MRRRKFITKLGAVGLAALLMVTSNWGMMPSVHATQIGQGVIVDESQTDAGTDTGAAGNPMLQTESGPVTADPLNYQIQTTQSNISFGKVYQEAIVNAQSIPIKNIGNTNISLSWNAVDPDHAFYVTAPDSLLLNAGMEDDFQVEPNTSLAPGKYQAEFIFGSDEDAGYVKGVHVTVSVTIQENEPYVSSVDVSPSNVSMTKGSSYQFSATVTGDNDPDTAVNWAVGGAQNGGTKISSDGTLTVSASETSNSLTVTATSRQDSSVEGQARVTLTGGNHTVAVKANPNEGGNVSGGGAVNTNGSCTVTASANNGYLFTGWTVNGNTVSNSNTYQVNNVTSDMQLVANFKRNTVKVTLNVNHSKRGTVTGGGTIAYGGNMSLQAKPNNGYVFKNWSENGKTISEDENITLNNITSDRNITANFATDDYDVHITCNPKGAGKVSGEGNYDDGDDITISETPSNGYTFDCWTANGKVISHDQSFVIKDIDQDINLVANFIQHNTKTYTIESGVTNAGGVISPSGKNQIPEGANIIYTIVPKSGYKVIAVAVDNQQVGAVSSYTFQNVKGAHSIVAAFAAKETTVSNHTDSGSTQSNNQQQNTQQQNTQNTNNQSQTVIQETENAGNTNNSQSSQNAQSIQDDDTYIMDMDTTDVPTDDATGTDAEISTDLDEMTGVLQILNITPDDARTVIETGEDQELLKIAFDNNFLQVTVNNEYAADSQETANDTYISNPTIPNFFDVLQASFTEEEKMKVFEGDQITLNVNITDYSQFIADEDKKAIDQGAKAETGLQIGQYFDIVLMKTMDGNSQVITELPTEMEVVMAIPEELKKENREYCIIRSHMNADGSKLVSVIRDTDTNPDTITFKSDKFSAYAIAYVQEGGLTTVQKQIFAGAIFLVIMIILITLVFTITKSASRKRRRRARK